MLNSLACELGPTSIKVASRVRSRVFLFPSCKFFCPHRRHLGLSANHVETRAARLFEVKRSCPTFYARRLFSGASVKWWGTGSNLDFCSLSPRTRSLSNYISQDLTLSVARDCRCLFGKKDDIKGPIGRRPNCRRYIATLDAYCQH
jgi:hypothetical protein